MVSKARLFTSPMLNMILIYFFSFLAIYLNVAIIGSSIVGFVSSMIYVYMSSVLCGNVFFKDEGFWHKILLGFSVFILLLSLVASVTLGVYKLTTFLTLLVLFAIMSFLIILNARLHGFKALFAGMQRTSDVGLGVAEGLKRRFVFNVERVLQVLYVILFAASLFLLLVSRSGEVDVVWNVMHPAFFPVFFGSTVVLLLVLFSKAGKRTKLLLVLGHSLLVHSLLVIVMNPGLHGDQFYELGYARDVYEKGENVPSLLDFVSGGTFSLFRTTYFVARKRVYQALVVVFANMFNVDVYWSHILLTPVLWSIIVPFITYKITKRLGGNETSSFFAAFLSLSVPTLIWWGSVTIPDTLGKVFFALAAYFTVEYVSFRERKFSLFLLAFVAMSVAFLTEFINGILFFAVLLLAFAFREYRTNKNIKTKVLFMITTGISFFVFPVSLIALEEVRATPGYLEIQPPPIGFVPEKLLSTDLLTLIFGSYIEYPLRFLLPLTLIPLLGFIGLLYVVMSTSNKRYNRSVVLFLLLTEIVFLVEYRVLKYGMRGFPFSAERVWVFRDLLIVPFGAIIMVQGIKEIHSRIRATSFRFPKLRLLAFSVMALIFCTIVSGVAVLATENAYAKSAPAVLQPTPYEVEAIEYIHKNTPEKYVVICDSNFRNLAIGMRGWEHLGDFNRAAFYKMANNPSLSTAASVMVGTGASVCYFVVSTRTHKDINRVVESAQKVFGVHAVFGDGKLYVFRYPPQERSYAIPLRVNSGNYSRVNYVLEYELNATHTLSEVLGHLDPNSIRVIASDGSEVPTQFDYYQGWLDDCSTADNWSGLQQEGKVTSYVGSDGDILTCNASFTTEGPIVARLKLSRFEKDGGNLTIDTTKYKYVEVKWKANIKTYVRVVLWKKDLATPVKFVTTFPPTKWEVWHYDISAFGPLSGLWFDIYQGDWAGDYRLYIDWIRFIGDTGTVRFLYNGTANTVDSYQIEYNMLENTESGNSDGLPKKSYPNGISTRDEINFYNLTWNWDDRVVNFLIDKEATRWFEAPGLTFSYSLKVDDVNILTSDPNNRGGIGIMQRSDSTSNISISFENAQLVSNGSVMAELRYETNGYGNLYIRIYKGEYLRIVFLTENKNSTVGSTDEKYSWLISTDASDDEVYYLKEDGNVAVENLYGNESSGVWTAQSLGQYETNGYLITLCNPTEILANYSASYNNFGFATQDFISYSSGSVDNANFIYIIGKNQSAEQMKDITLGMKNVPLVNRWIPYPLTIRVVDLLNQPVADVEIEVKELETKVTTDIDGWATVSVLEGQWTLVASKKGVTNEKEIDVFANTVTLQRLNIIKIGMFTFNILESVLVFGLILIGIVFLLVLINRKIFSRART